MSYQVIARKWRPQRFDDVVGQQVVTRTLRNALASGRLAQAFVFAGPRGVGKTTTARILARALSCVNGPTADPCGRCEACVEIAEGRDIDVLEIDAATHSGVGNVRDVIISGLGIMPVRNRYKVFIIDEVHQLSTPSFNALLKSIEEPPPHVVFMMATTEIDKIPETVLSRAQVFELRTIGTRAIAEQLEKIAVAEGLHVGEEALTLIARDADGSMRDAQSKLDQVLAFTGPTITTEDVATVLGLVGRDLLFEIVTAVADEEPAAAFSLVAKAVELGYDLRLVCRELSRVVRDLLVVAVDPSRLTDPDIAAEGERERVRDLAARFSREDLLRAFDLLGRAEGAVRSAAQPRYHLEMALLRWIYVRKLVPIEDLIQAMSSGGLAREAAPHRAPSPAPVGGLGTASTPSRPPTTATPPQRLAPTRSSASSAGASPAAEPPTGPVSRPTAPSGIKDPLLAELRRQKAVLYNTVVAQAQSVEATGDTITFTFAPAQRALREIFEQNRAWLEATALQAVGQRILVKSQVEAAGASDPSAGAAEASRASEARQSSLLERAMADASVQALLEVFPTEIRDVEEM